MVSGLTLAGIGVGIGWRTAGQVAELTEGFRTDPAAMVETELPRMQKVNANSKTTFVVFGVATVIGLGLIFAVRASWALGLGSVLVLTAGLGFLIDGLASRRAVPYTAALEKIADQHQVGGGS